LAACAPRVAVAGQPMPERGGYGFVRHLLANVTEEGGVWSADAVYTNSPTLPGGRATIDTVGIAAACAESGIPMV
jgi:hypothetical protein